MVQGVGMTTNVPGWGENGICPFSYNGHGSHCGGLIWDADVPYTPSHPYLSMSL